MEINQMIHNFRITATQRVEELAATLVEMQHEKTGARLVWLDRVSDNKTFGIAFRTIPEDDTGVFHILEHSVLCGSRNYPVREPFVELMKSSMQTFLNAMTYPDKTFYPVSSRNEKDFNNLMRVYLDAVFFPAIYEKPEIFWQEGWHYELREGVPAAYKGVVFNEMKGAFASADSLMQNEINRLMFPDTCYRYVSGGDPAHITELSYEQFLESHRRFYHPSNAYIFLDGSMDLDGTLAIIDAEYLTHFDFREMDTDIAPQKPVKGSSTAYYALSPTEPLKGRSRVAWAYGMGDYTCRKEAMAMNVLSELLLGSNYAPLKRKILLAGLAEDVSMGVMGGQLQNVLLITADNVADGKAGKLQGLIKTTLRKLIRHGLDHEHIKATLANMELQYRERNYGHMPQGLGFADEVLSSWLYGGDPAANLSVVPLFEELNGLVDTGWYEQLLSRVLLENGHTCQVLLLPSHTAELECQQQEAECLARAEASWCPEKRQALLRQQDVLDAWQASQDSPEDIDKLPRLELSDISEKPEDIPTEVEETCGVTLLRHDIPTGGLSYWNLYFDISDLDQAALSEVAFLCETLGSLGTKRYSPMALQKKMFFCMGELDFSIKSFSRDNTPETCRYFLCAAFSCLESKLPQAIDLVLEILRNTDFSNSRFLRGLVMQCKLRLEQMVIGAGNSIAMGRVMAGVSAEGVVMECTTGYAYLQAVRDMEKETASVGNRLKALYGKVFGANAAKEIALGCRLQALCGKIFDAGRLTLSITSAQKELPVARLVDGLPNGGKCSPVCAVQAWGARKEGIVIPADVSFAVQGGLLPFTGRMQVAAQIVSLAYLWNAVRVQGGAYGAGMGINPRGCGLFYSYRDPNAAGSLACYGQTADVLKQLAFGNMDLTGFIIGTISGTEPVLLAGAQGREADSWYFRELSYADRCASRKEMLTISAQDLVQLAQDIASMYAQGGICVVGSKTQVDACGLDQVYVL